MNTNLLNYKSMKNVRTFFILLAFLVAGVGSAYAETAAQLKTRIEAFAHGGTGTLSCSVSGNTVTVTGTVTGVTEEDFYLNINAGVTVLWKAAFEGEISSNMLSLAGSGTFEVAEGASVIQQKASYNAISAGGTVTCKVSGGTVGAPKTAIYGSYGTSTVEVSGGTVNGQIMANTIKVSGGTVQATGDYDSAIKFQDSEGKATISGGTMLAEGGYAIDNNYSGTTLTISGGILFAYGKASTDVINGAYTPTPLNSIVLVAWDKAAGNTTYTAGTSNDILILPATATAVWAKQGSNSGISVASGSTTGFIPIEGVTVGTTGIASIESAGIKIYPNPVKDVLIIESGELKIENVEIYSVTGQLLQSKIVNLQSDIIIDIAHLLSGTYFLKMQTASGELVQKVIKE